jgi:hypothetical protein
MAQTSEGRRDVNATRAATSAEVGDVAVVMGHRVGDVERTGEIVEVLGAPDHRHYRVRWDDGHESVLYPGGDVVIRHHERRRGSG